MEQQIKETPKATESVFNPQAEYNWSPDEVFTLTGKEFELLFNNIVAVVNEPFSIATTPKLLTMYKVLETKFKQGLESNQIKQGEVIKD